MQQHLSDWHNGITAASLPELKKKKSIRHLLFSSSKCGPVPALKSADKTHSLLQSGSHLTVQSLNGLGHFHSSPNESDRSNTGLLSISSRHHHLACFWSRFPPGNKILPCTLHLVYSSSPLLHYSCVLRSSTSEQPFTCVAHTIFTARVSQKWGTSPPKKWHSPLHGGTSFFMWSSDLES